MSKRNKIEKGLVAKFLPSIVRNKGWEKQLDLHSLFPRWDELVTEDAAEHAKPLKIERGVLWLEVENSSWLQELQYQKVELLEILNGFLSIGRLEDIKMILPTREDQNSYDCQSRDGTEISFSRPSREKVKQFEKQVGAIADEECRQALMQFWYLANACKKNDK